MKKEEIASLAFLAFSLGSIFYAETKASRSKEKNPSFSNKNQIDSKVAKALIDKAEANFGGIKFDSIFYSEDQKPYYDLVIYSDNYTKNPDMEKRLIADFDVIASHTIENNGFKRVGKSSVRVIGNEIKIHLKWK